MPPAGGRRGCARSLSFEFRKGESFYQVMKTATVETMVVHERGRGQEERNVTENRE